MFWGPELREIHLQLSFCCLFVVLVIQVRSGGILCPYSHLQLFPTAVKVGKTDTTSPWLNVRAGVCVCAGGMMWRISGLTQKRHLQGQTVNLSPPSLTPHLTVGRQLQDPALCSWKPCCLQGQGKKTKRGQALLYCTCVLPRSCSTEQNISKRYGPSKALITSAWLLKCIYKKLWKLVPKANPCDLYYLMKEYVEPLENEHQRHTDRQSGLPSRKAVLWK